MKRKQKTIVLSLFLYCVITFSINGMERTVQFHYFDINQNSLEQYESVWSTLHKYFGDKIPKKIIIEYKEGMSSKFDCESNRIFLSLNHLANSPIKVIAHETSHLALCNLTKGTNLFERFRFFDEGFANIMGAQATNSQDKYKKIALNIAAIQYQKENVSFSKVQDWSSYYQNSSARYMHSYHVGASFIYYLIDSYGERSLYDFFVDIGNTKDLGLTFRNLFNKTTVEIENEWMNYLKKIHVDPSLVEPYVVSTFPPNNANNVDINLEEIFVVFNTDMMPNICVGTYQDHGFSYKDAYWKNSKVLAIRVKKKLKHDSTINLSLGYPQRCSLYSSAGIALPIYHWRFTTQKTERVH
jgi:hypothetical protein